MDISNFKRDFKQLGGVYITDKIALLRNPLELYNLTTNTVIASFDDLDEALRYELNGKTLEKLISAWETIVFPAEFGGRGGESGLGFSGGWPSGDIGGNDNTKDDFPARMNVKVNVKRTYKDMLKAFTETHAAAGEEHGVVVNEHGFATKYKHGNTGSISGLTGNGKEIAIHNHPAGGWPTFSKEDVVNTAMGTRRGIVAVSSAQGRSEESAKYAGTYSFIKGTHFNASAFIKGVNSAALKGRDYNDAVSKWLRANQKKYGYTYSYKKA